MAEALDGGCRAYKPGSWYAKDFAVAALSGIGGGNARGERDGNSDEVEQAGSGAPIRR